jgi:hypothetical protein
MKDTLESFLPKIQESLDIASRDLNWLSDITLDASDEKVAKGSKTAGECGSVTISQAMYVALPVTPPLYKASEDPRYLERHHVTHAFKTLFEAVEAEIAEGSTVLATRLPDVPDIVINSAVVTDKRSGISFCIWDYGHPPLGRVRYTVNIAYGVA